MASSADRGEVLVSCHQLSCGYDDEIVLSGVDLSVRRGEIVVILGGSGSGKSTLLRVMTGLLPPRAGQMLLFGEPLYQVNDERGRELLRRTGVLFQLNALFGTMTLLENVAVPLHELTDLPDPVIEKMARMRLALVGLEGLEQRLPAGVSGGQRKRAALARASVMDPEIIFCDEPTAGLDPVVAAGIDELLRHMREVLRVTIVAVTHELASVRAIADRVIMLAEHGVRAEGTFDELARSTDSYVYDFFHRVPRDLARAPMNDGATIWADDA